MSLASPVPLAERVGTASFETPRRGPAAGRFGGARTGRSLAPRLRSLGLVLIGAALLMWTAVVNGRPPVFTDTALYYTQAEYLFEALGLVSPAHAVEPADDPTALPARPGAPNVSASIDRARSPVYGAFVYALQRLGGLWLVAFAQAFIAAGAIRLLWRAARPPASEVWYVALMAALALLTPLPFFATWIMPDVFAGIMGCALLALLVYPERIGWVSRLALAGLLAAGVAVHRSNLLVALGMTALAMPLLRLGGASWRGIGGRLAMVVAYGLVAVAANGALERVVETRAGEPVGAPPFLSARVLVDGPGRLYLQRACAGSPFELCRFRDRPILSSDQVLWSIRRRTAVFLADTPAGRLRMGREDSRFAAAAAVAAPWMEAKAAAWNALQQFVQANVYEPLRDQAFYVSDRYWSRTVLPRLLPRAAACRSSCPPVVGRGLALGLEIAGLVLCLVPLAWRLWPRRTRTAAPRDRRDLLALSLAVILLAVNAGVCGALSGPFPRYQARVIWLLPLFAMLLFGAGGRGRARVDAPGASG